MIKLLRCVWFSRPDDSFLFTSHHQTCQNEAQMLIFCFLWNLFVCWLVWRFSSFCLKVRSQRPCDVRAVWSCHMYKNIRRIMDSTFPNTKLQCFYWRKWSCDRTFTWSSVASSAAHWCLKGFDVQNIPLESVFFSIDHFHNHSNCQKLWGSFHLQETVSSRASSCFWWWLMFFFIRYFCFVIFCFPLTQ